MRRLQAIAVIAFLFFFAWQVWDVSEYVKRSMDNRERIAARCESSVHEYLDLLTPTVSGVIATSSYLSTEETAPVLPAEQYP